MSENIETPNIPENNQEMDISDNEDEKEPVKEIKHAEVNLTRGPVRRSDKTQKETVKDCKKRAIEAFKNGQIDPEYRVVQMGNGKYRTYKRKTPLVADPINVNQIQHNTRNVEIVDDTAADTIPTKTKPVMKQHDPFSDIVYYNMSNQISKQRNKRLDMVNAELERLRHKNSKLKGKYKQLKQAIYITEEEEHDEPEPQPQPSPQQPQTISQPQTPLRDAQLRQQPEAPIYRPTRRTPTINFNKFFN